MKITGTAFLIGSLAIAGLPPLNGFVSEFLVFLGGFRGLALDKTSFAHVPAGHCQPGHYRSLALACFTKVVGRCLSRRATQPGLRKTWMKKD